MPRPRTAALSFPSLFSVLALFIFSGQLHAQVTSTSGGTCNDTYSGFFNGDVTISVNQTCRFTSGGIAGNVLMNGGTFSIGPSTSINGNLEIQDIPAGSAQNQICGTTVTGKLLFHDNGTVVEIGAASMCASNTIVGNLHVQNNTASVTVAFNNVHKNLLCQNNPLITGGSDIAQQNQGCPTTLQASAFATSNGSGILFKSPTGTTVLNPNLKSDNGRTP